MAIENIIKKIEADAQAARDKIAADTEKEVKALSEQSEAKAVKEAEKTLARAEEDGKRLAHRTLQQAELAGRKKLLSTKQALVESTFEKVEKKLSGLDDSAYLGLIKRLILELKGSGEYTILSSEQTAKLLDKEFINKLNKDLQAKAGFTIKSGKEHLETDRGFTLRQKKLDFNFTFPALLTEARKSIYHDVVGILFGESTGQ